MSRHLCVVGVQWGDEGKGKIVDVLAKDFDMVVRFQGGANAGHTVKFAETEFVFHLVPSGILQEGKTCVIGNGVVLDPKALLEELDQLKASKLKCEDSLRISDRAHVVLPYHKVLDAVKERSSKTRKIGTTLRGIGPCYTDKAARLGIRMADLISPDRFRTMLEHRLELKNHELEAVYGEAPLELEPIYEEYTGYGKLLKRWVSDISRLLAEEDARGARILFEGAQGSLLDVDLGTYPFVTSSNTSFLGLGAGTGFSPRKVETVYGISKAYTTRVGEGPFPTELADETGDLLRQVGHEYGATTGRPRRCGWLDLAAIQHAVRFGDVDALVISKLDVLDVLDEIQVAVAYRCDGRQLDDFPTNVTDDITPEYRTLKGWKRSIADCRSFGDLPEETREYLQFIVDQSGCPIAMVSVGKDRSQVICLDPWLQPRGGAR